jgi:hypothetical protein
MGLLNSLFKAFFDPSKENRNNLKGASGEAKSTLGMFLFLPDEYIVLSNVTVPTPKGTTQIDHVVVSQYGIHVIETKNIQGAIYGDDASPKWTVFLGSRKLQISNPLRQNYGYIKALAAALRMPESNFHSLVFFWADNCSFKTPMPENVRREGLCTYIRSKTQRLIEPEKVMDVVRAINNARLPDTEQTTANHVAGLKERFQSPHKAGDACPRCEGGKLVLRTARQTGREFLGCSMYPKCKHTEPVS